MGAKRLLENGELRKDIPRRYGRLEIIGIAGRMPTTKHLLVICRCDCGTVKTIGLNNLRSQGTESCGCLHSERTSAKATTHGLSQSPEYLIRNAMINRCKDPKNKEFLRYGARGIKVCERWRESFENFIEDMGMRPSADHSLDRIDNSGNYEPGNVRWATRLEQGRNKRNNVMITHNGETLSAADWGRRLGICAKLIRSRFHLGWPSDRVLGIMQPARSA